jgi:hypothetical protein
MTRTFQDIINEMPVGLERSLGRILSQRVGKDNAIERDELLALVRRHPGLEKTQDRQMRLKIQLLREQGIRICHFERRVDGKTVFGYYLAATDAEYFEFRQWYGSYANTIWRAIRSMDEKREVLTSEGAVEPPPGIEVQGQFFI